MEHDVLMFTFESFIHELEELRRIIGQPLFALWSKFIPFAIDLKFKSVSLERKYAYLK